MADDVVVLGSGYAGTGAIQTLERELDGEADLTWISDVDHHFVLHESHRCIREPSVADRITFPVETLKSPATRFVHGEVTAIDVDAREVTVDGDDVVDYDYLVVGIGTRTAFFGIDGLRQHALTLKNRADAIETHEALTRAARAASRSEPARVVVGGAGLSGIQSAGEVAAFRDKHRAPIEIQLVEGLDRIFPGNDPIVQAKLRKLLEAADVDIMTGEFIGAVDSDTVYVGEETELAYDVLVWTGGIRGQDVAETASVEKDERSYRIEANSTFQTSDDRVFAIGDAALVEQPGTDTPAPPTAQAAWQAATVAGENVARDIRGQPLAQWTYEDKGTLISVGDKALAHGVKGIPLNTFGGRSAQALKKSVAARWITKVAGPAAAARAFPDM